MTRRLALAVAIVALLAGPGSAQAADELAPGTVARVGERSIAKSAFDHLYAIGVRAEGAPKDAADEESLRFSAMVTLLDNAWVELEAAERRIEVSRRSVRARFRRVKRQTYKTEAAYQRYLKRTGQTEADVLLRVRIGLLEEAIRKKVTAPAKTTRGKERLLARFTRSNFRKWKGRTVCGEGYFEELRCGSVVPIAAPPPG